MSVSPTSLTQWGGPRPDPRPPGPRALGEPAQDKATEAGSASLSLGVRQRDTEAQGLSGAAPDTTLPARPSSISCS